jgi:hypothetical protein
MRIEEIKAKRQQMLRQRVIARRLSAIGHNLTFACTDLAIAADQARRAGLAFAAAWRRMEGSRG